MGSREAGCHCGQLRLQVEGDPFAVSICNCVACQRRTGSAFGMQAAFKSEQVDVIGRSSGFTRISDEADRKEHVFHLSPLRARRSSPPNRPSRISSLSQSGRSPTRRFRRRRSRATTLGATPGCTCRIRCGRSPRSCGGTRPRTTRTSTRFATNRPFALSSADISDRSSQPLRFPWIRPRDSGSRG